VLLATYLDLHYDYTITQLYITKIPSITRGFTKGGDFATPTLTYT